MKNNITPELIQAAIDKISEDPSIEKRKKYWEFCDEILPLQKDIWAMIFNEGRRVTIKEARERYEKAYEKVYGKEALPHER